MLVYVEATLFVEMAGQAEARKKGRWVVLSVDGENLVMSEENGSVLAKGRLDYASSEDFRVTIPEHALSGVVEAIQRSDVHEISIYHCRERNEVSFQIGNLYRFCTCKE